MHLVAVLKAEIIICSRSGLDSIESSRLHHGTVAEQRQHSCAEECRQHHDQKPFCGHVRSSTRFRNDNSAWQHIAARAHPGLRCHLFSPAECLQSVVGSVGDECNATVPLKFTVPSAL